MSTNYDPSNNHQDTNSTSQTVSSSYTVFNEVDARVGKSVVGSDGAAAWQLFRSHPNNNNKKKDYVSQHTSVAPTAPLKALDRANGVSSWQEERQKEIQIRQMTGAAMMNVGYTEFKSKPDDNGMTKKERRRIEKRLIGEDQEYYIPSQTWQGPRWDYVFTTKEQHGTGYYYDGMDSLKKLKGEITEEEELNMKKASLEFSSTNKKRSQDTIDPTSCKEEESTSQSCSSILKKKKKIKHRQGPVIVTDPTNPLELVAAALQQKQQQHWESAVDYATGKTYYYNRATGERSWEKPLPTGWQKANTDNENNIKEGTGKVYYYNVVTGETSWDVPT